MKLRGGFVLSVVLALAAFVAPAAAQEDTITVAAPETPTSLHNLYLQVAYEKGFFKKNGLAVAQFMQLKGGPLATQAVVAGQVDVTATDVEGVLHAVASGYPIRAISAPASRLSYVIGARADIKSFADLKGKLFAVSRAGALSQYITFPFLAQAGLTKTDIQWLSVGSSEDRLHALAADRVQGAVLYLDSMVEVQDDKNIHTLAHVADLLPLYPHELPVMRKDDLDKHPDKVLHIVQSIIEACRYMTTHRDETIDVFLKYRKIERSQAEEAYADLIRLKAWGVNGGMTAEKLNAAMDLSLQNKAIDKPIPLDQWADFHFQDEALQRLGGPVSE